MRGPELPRPRRGDRATPVLASSNISFKRCNVFPRRASRQNIQVSRPYASTPHGAEKSHLAFMYLHGSHAPVAGVDDAGVDERPWSSKRVYPRTLSRDLHKRASAADETVRRTCGPGKGAIPPKIPKGAISACLPRRRRPRREIGSRWSWPGEGGQALTPRQSSQQCDHCGQRHAWKHTTTRLHPRLQRCHPLCFAAALHERVM